MMDAFSELTEDGFTVDTLSSVAVDVMVELLEI
jgi:hypothetical protein